jgi:hypothetical protein
MKNSTKLWLSCLPFLLMLVGVGVVPLYQSYQENQIQQQQKNTPLTSTITVTDRLEVRSGSLSRRTNASCVHEIGLVRIVMPTSSQRGESTTRLDLKIATPVIDHGSSGSNSSGNLKHTHRAIPHGTRHTVSGPGFRYSFDYIQGCVCTGGQRINMLDKPQLIYLDRTGSVQSIEPLPPQTISISGNPEAVQKIKEIAQKYANGDDSGSGIKAPPPP